MPYSLASWAVIQKSRSPSAATRSMGCPVCMSTNGEIVVTCDPGNPASARTCETAGGTYVETAQIPEDNEMYAEGKRLVKVYRFEL